MGRDAAGGTRPSRSQSSSDGGVVEVVEGEEEGEGRYDIPVFSSRVEWLRLATISLMDDTEPFLENREW